MSDRKSMLTISAITREASRILERQLEIAKEIRRLNPEQRMEFKRLLEEQAEAWRRVRETSKGEHIEFPEDTLTIWRKRTLP